MFQKKEGVDIVCEIVGISTIEAAIACFESRLDATNFSRINQINDPAVLIKIANSIFMCDQVLQKCEETILPTKDHTIHYDLKDEQGRIVDRTFYISNPDEDVRTLTVDFVEMKQMSNPGVAMKQMKFKQQFLLDKVISGINTKKNQLDSFNDFRSKPIKFANNQKKNFLSKKAHFF